MRMALVGAAACIALGLAPGCTPATTVAQHVAPQAQTCILIDTDFDIDDMMAIPMVIRNRHVAAIVTTEGASTAPLGASALVRLLARPAGHRRPLSSPVHPPLRTAATRPSTGWPRSALPWSGSTG